MPGAPPQGPLTRAPAPGPSRPPSPHGPGRAARSLRSRRSLPRRRGRGFPPRAYRRHERLRPDRPARGGRPARPRLSGRQPDRRRLRRRRRRLAAARPCACWSSRRPTSRSSTSACPTARGWSCSRACAPRAAGAASPRGPVAAAARRSPGAARRSTASAASTAGPTTTWSSPRHHCSGRRQRLTVEDRPPRLIHPGDDLGPRPRDDGPAASVERAAPAFGRQRAVHLALLLLHQGARSRERGHPGANLQTADGERLEHAREGGPHGVEVGRALDLARDGRADLGKSPDGLALGVVHRALRGRDFGLRASVAARASPGRLVVGLEVRPTVRATRRP